MIGFIGGVRRMAFSNAIRQIGRQLGREAMERITRGEASEDVSTRDQLKELATKTGKLALDELMRIGKEEFKKDIDKKQEDLNKKNGQLW